MRFVKFVFLIVVILSVLSGMFILAFNRYAPKLNSPLSILILGKGGEGHTAPDLTDTIILANLNTNLNKTGLLSLPRDIWIPEIRAKLNSSYYWDKQKGGNGFELASTSVSSITGILPSYYVVVDFSLFKDLINTVGGIDVEVTNSFVDEKYPIAGLENDLCSGDLLYRCRYETIRFDQGSQLMDGETALKFVRSRNAIGDEGTDLARELRQQKIIEAIKNKMLSVKVLGNPKIISKLYEVVLTHVESNVDRNTTFLILRFVLENRNNISFLSIPEEYIKISQNDKKYDYQYVFLPASNSWQEFQKWVKDNL